MKNIKSMKTVKVPLTENQINAILQAFRDMDGNLHDYDSVQDSYGDYPRWMQTAQEKARIKLYKSLEELGVRI